MKAKMNKFSDKEKLTECIVFRLVLQEMLKMNIYMLMCRK